MIPITKSVGAFDAKTHLSQYLQEVEGGACIEITRRGKRVAVLAPPEAREKSSRNVEDLIQRVRERRASYRVSGAEISDWKRAGRR